MKAMKCSACDGKGFIINKSDCVRYKHNYTNLVSGERISFCFYCGKKKPVKEVDL